MDKTGERYAAARRHVVTPPPMPATAAAAAGRRTDDERRLDHARAPAARGTTGSASSTPGARPTHTHTEIARHVRDDLGCRRLVGAVGDRRLRVGPRHARPPRDAGRLPGQRQPRRSPPTAEDVWRDFVEPARRNRWLEPGTLRTRPGTGTVGKSARFDAADGRLVHIWLDAKGDRCSVAVTCEQLAGPDEVEAQRALWRTASTRSPSAGRRQPSHGARAPSVLTP